MTGRADVNDRLLTNRDTARFSQQRRLIQGRTIWSKFHIFVQTPLQLHSVKGDKAPPLPVGLGSGGLFIYCIQIDPAPLIVYSMIKCSSDEEMKVIPPSSTLTSCKRLLAGRTTHQPTDQSASSCHLEDLEH